MLKKWRHHLRDILTLKRSEHSIAVGFAIGTFLAILPLLGLSVFVGVLAVLFCKRLNKFALFGAMAFWNPLVLIPIYWLSFAIGDALFDPLPVVEFKVTLLNQVSHFSRRFLLGNVLLASLLSTASYFVMKAAVHTYRRLK
jgi:uncharacterized protein